jgi:hypothetical protein
VRLEQVLQEAIDNPIERFVRESQQDRTESALLLTAPWDHSLSVPRMKESAVRDRTRALLYLDWQTMFHLRRSCMNPGDGAQGGLSWVLASGKHETQVSFVSSVLQAFLA